MKTIKLYLLLIVLTFQLNALGQSIILTLDGVASSTLCDEIWTEEGIDLQFTTTTTDDCSANNCFFGIEPTFVWLFPSRMTVDLSSVENIEKIEVEIDDFCGLNCTQAFISDENGMTVGSTGNNLVSTPETLTLDNSSGAVITSLAVSSCEGQIHAIRIYQDFSNSIDVLPLASFTIFPNPLSVKDDLYVKTSTPNIWSSLKQISVFNINGQLVYDQPTSSLLNQNELIIPASVLPRGIFFVQFELEKQVIRKKVVRL